MNDSELAALEQKALEGAQELAGLLTGQTITLAESCTGGLLGYLLTSVPGISRSFNMGFITYQNEAKTSLLGVPRTLLDAYGAVSAQTAEAMARGAADRAQADLSLAVTGIAGPDGGTPERPVGLVFIAACSHGKVTVQREDFGPGARKEIRLRSAVAAFALGVRVVNPDYSERT
jgi:nicotinamide-nucleotide amidase